MGFIINIDTLMLMIPKLLEHQDHVCMYRFSQDHLELLFNSIRAAGRDFSVFPTLYFFITGHRTPLKEDIHTHHLNSSDNLF